jgi:hypothetical protein
MKFEFNEYENVFGHPQIYKGVEIYPIVVRDMKEFNNCISVLTEMKNWSDDMEIIKMSYLTYLFANLDIESKMYVSGKLKEKPKTKRFQTIMRLCFGEDVTYKFSIEKNKVKIEINGELFSGKQFDEVRSIIFKQNRINHDDYMSQDFANEFERFLKLKQKNPPTLEEMIVSYRVAMKLPYEEIYNVTIYQLYADLQRYQLLKNFEVYTYPMLKSGKEPDNWIKHVVTDPYEGMFCGVDDIANKIK